MIQKTINKINPNLWKDIAVFYVISIFFSAPFRLNFIHLNSFSNISPEIKILFLIFKAIGPLLGYIFMVIYLKKGTNSITLFGFNKIKSIIVICIIPLALTFIGIENNVNLNKHYYAFIFSITLVIYALFEEFGWRGYLQDVLKDYIQIVQVFIIGTLWYIWHLNFLLPTATLKSSLIQYVFILIGSWGILKFTNRTKSLLFATTVHLCFNLVSETPIELSTSVMIVSITMMLLVAISRFERK